MGRGAAPDHRWAPRDSPVVWGLLTGALPGLETLTAPLCVPTGGGGRVLRGGPGASAHQHLLMDQTALLRLRTQHHPTAGGAGTRSLASSQTHTAANSPPGYSAGGRGHTAARQVGEGGAAKKQGLQAAPPPNKSTPTQPHTHHLHARSLHRGHTWDRCAQRLRDARTVSATQRPAKTLRDPQPAPGGRRLCALPRACTSQAAPGWQHWDTGGGGTRHRLSPLLSSCCVGLA